MWTAEGLVRPGIYIWPRELQSPIRARLTRALPGILALPGIPVPLIRVRREILARPGIHVPLIHVRREIPARPGTLARLILVQPNDPAELIISIRQIAKK